MYILYIIITNRHKIQDPLITNTDLIYNMFYRCLVCLDNRDYDANTNSALGEYANLVTLLNYWLKGKNRKQNDGGLNEISSIVLYIHPKLLPHYIHCIRYLVDIDRILGFLLEFKIYITEDTNHLMQAIGQESDDSRVSQSHQILIYQGILKELVLLFLRFQHDQCKDSFWISYYSTVSNYSRNTLFTVVQ